MKTKILLIEDNQEMRENIAEILELSDYEVCTAANGKLGVETAHKENPDLIICDIMMPELDGYGVLHILNQNPDTASIPFIFLTAKADKSDFRKGMNLGADDYLTKPFENVDLLNAIEVRLKKSEFVKANFVSSKEGLTEFFQKVSSLKGFSQLANKKQNRVYKKKEYIFMEGDQPKDLYFINHGKVKTVRTNPDGKELITDIHIDGSFIGYVPLLENTVYQEAAVALEDSDVSVLPKLEFLKLIYTNREVAGKFIQILSNHIAEAENRLIEIAYKSVRQRVAASLLQLKNLYHKTAKDPNSFAIARKDLSSIVATATESLNRTLADFKEEGLIDMHHHSIYILQSTKLEKLAG
jgi:CheY-like chemotaxis protein/CRP-like cAMP-binding protein